MPRTSLTPAELKTKAIDFALKRLRKEGFENVKLSDVAKDLGVSHAALYSHFENKAALLDAVTERWLGEIDRELDLVTKLKKDPCERILLWTLTLHRLKIEKVKNDPELFKAFDLTREIAKPLGAEHMRIMHEQLEGLLTEAAGRKRTRDVDEMARLLFEATLSFHHPRLVVHALREKREPQLRAIVETLLKGFGLLKAGDSLR